MKSNSICRVAKGGPANARTSWLSPHFSHVLTERVPQPQVL
jgi:hypothetical protein